MKVILVDDESITLKILNQMLSGFKGIEIAGTFKNAEDALAFLKENKVDGAFVDINMEGESGIELARNLSLYNIDTDVIFITSSTEHALEAFDVYALDYIVKPVKRERLERTIARLQSKYKKSLASDSDNPSYDLSIYCLGGLDVLNRDFDNTKWISAKSEELFFYLLLNQNRSVSRHEIIDEIFGSMTLKKANTYLNTTIYQLRKAIEANNLNASVDSYNDGYRLTIYDAYIDYLAFENHIKQMKTIDQSNIEYAIETEKLYKGDLFGSKPYIWSLPERERVFGLYDNFAKLLIKSLIKLNNRVEALRVAKKLLKLNELDEEANSLLLQIYSISKDKSSFIKHYEKYASLIKKETGNNPSKEIINFYVELRQSFD